jgi:ketosteroid isomerase-like protein
VSSATERPAGTTPATRVVERYLDRIVAHDWDAVADCLSDDVVRIGPFGDKYTPKDAYLAFLSNLMPSLQGYSMRVDRVLDAGGVVLVELTETVELDGVPVVTPEALVFELDAATKIARIVIYIQRLRSSPSA